MMSLLDAWTAPLVTGSSGGAAYVQAAFSAVLVLLGRALAPAGELVMVWLHSGLLFGTLTAIATALVLVPLRRRIHPSILALFWLVVLVKFVVPVGPAWSGSLATLTSAWLPASAAAPCAAAEPSVDSAAKRVTLTWITCEECPTGAASGLAPEPRATAPSGASVMPALSQLAPALATIYLLAVGAVFVRRVRAYRDVLRATRRLPAADAALRADVERACRRFGTRVVRDVRVSEAAPAPYIIGLLRPTLVLSRRQLSDADAREAVILHELAHMRRGDPWVRCLQWIVGTLLFFWPVVAWVNRRIDLARETACDEWALRHGRISPAQYARCLLDAARPVRGGWFAHRPAAMAIDKAHVERRIEMVLSMGARRRAGRLTYVLPAACLLGWSGFVLTGANAALPARELQPKAPPADGQPTTVVVHATATDTSQAECQMHIQCEAAGGPQDVLWQSDMPPMFMLHRLPADAIVLFQSDGDGQNENQEIFVAARHGDGADPTLDEFFAAHPTADANGDGAVTRTERDAYLVALAMSDSAAVLGQYPKADRNGDGKLDAVEASLLVLAPMLVDRPALTPGCDALGALTHCIQVTPQEGAGPDGEKRIVVRVNPSAEALADGAGCCAKAGAEKVVVRHSGDMECAGVARAVVRTANGKAADAGEHQVIVLRPQEGSGEEKVVTLPDGKQLRITGIQKGADGTVTGDVDDVMIRMRQADGGELPADGLRMINVKLPAPATEWLLSSIDATPTAREVAGYVPVIEGAPLTIFLQMNPKADANGDGVLTMAERDAFIEAHMTAARAKVLAHHPDADANGDGLLSNEEMKAFFQSMTDAHKAAAGAKTMRVRVAKPDGGASDGALEVEVLEDDE